MSGVSFSEEEKARLTEQASEWERALLKNCQEFAQAPEVPLLMAGDQYAGIWLEHNQDNLFLAEYAPESAWASQKVFMDFQREDGLLPFALPLDFRNPSNFFYGFSACYWQIQSIYPFTRCALEIARKTGRPEKDYERIYQAGAAYDAWLVRYRGGAEKDLVEMFCEYDTGHDNDPRVKDGGIPSSCPGKDAVNMPDLPVMPILSVDLSAMMYGARIALAELAECLGRKREAGQWRLRAERTRKAIRKLLFDPEDTFYYDRSPQGFRKYRTEHVTRLFLNRVLSREEFDAVYERYFTTPGREFRPAYPIPAVSVDDPHFDRNCPRNSWGSNSQALTLLRAILWMDFYGRSADLTEFLSRWLRAVCDHPESTCQQELNPFTGAPVGDGRNYTPTLLVLLSALKRLNIR